MSTLYDIYQPGTSWLHRLDARVKVISTVCACILLLVMRNVWFMLAMLVLLHIVLVSGGMGRQRIAWVWRMALPTMIMIALLWILFYRQEGKVLFTWWFIHISAQNLAEGMAVALRIGSMAFAVFVWLFSTDQSTLVRSLVALGLPYDWGLTLAISLRYLPTMANAFRMISDAQQARALDLRQGNLIPHKISLTPSSRVPWAPLANVPMFGSLMPVGATGSWEAWSSPPLRWSSGHAMLWAGELIPCICSSRILGRSGMSTARGMCPALSIVQCVWARLADAPGHILHRLDFA